jgi:hypothetical protein
VRTLYPLHPTTIDRQWGDRMVNFVSLSRINVELPLVPPISKYKIFKRIPVSMFLENCHIAVSVSISRIAVSGHPS